MDLMNGLQRVNLTAMRLATLIWLAGIACCVPGMAAAPGRQQSLTSCLSLWVSRGFAQAIS